MARKIINITLPEWAWVDGSEHEKGGDPLDGRSVVLHVRSASVIEFFEEDDFVPAPHVQTYKFEYKNAYGDIEKHVAVLHYCAVTNSKEVTGEILRNAAKWYTDYLRWEDGNIAQGNTVLLN